MTIRPYDRRPSASPAPVTPAQATPRKRYRLVESIDGGEFRRCSIDVLIPEANLSTTLQNWLEARSSYWYDRGYYRLTGGSANEAVAVFPKRHAWVVMRVEEVERSEGNV